MDTLEQTIHDELRDRLTRDALYWPFVTGVQPRLKIGSSKPAGEYSHARPPLPDGSASARRRPLTASLISFDVGANNLIHFIGDGGLTVCLLDPDTLTRAFALMQQYANHPMDLADASLVAMAEAENLHKVFTIGRRDFAAYRIKRGHRLRSFELIDPARRSK